MLKDQDAQGCLQTERTGYWLDSHNRTEERQSHTWELDGYRMASKHQTALFEDDFKELVLWHMWLWKNPLLTAVHRRKILQFTKARADLTWVDWSIMLLSDESRFTLFQNDGHVFVRRIAHEAYRNSCVYPQWNLVAMVWLCGVQCHTEELGFSLHWKATSTRMAIWTFSGILPFPQHIFGDMKITLFF